MKDGEIKRIIVSRTDKIGDLILSIPSFFMIKKMYPNAELVVLVRKYNYEIVKNLPYIDRIIKIDEYGKKELLDKIKYFNANVFIALYNDAFVSHLARASKAKIKVGPYSKLCSFFTFNRGVFQKRSKSIKNEAEYNLDLVRKIDKKLFDKVFEINTSIHMGEDNRKAAEMFFKTYNIQGKTLVVNPFVGGSAKNINESQYISLLKKFKERNVDTNIIIVCHISDEEAAERIYHGVGGDRIYLYPNGGGLLNIAAIIDKCDVYLGVSTGPTHMAGALKKRIVAIYSNMKTKCPTRWGIFGNDNKVKYLILHETKRQKKLKFFKKYTEEDEEKVLEMLDESIN